MRKLYRLLALSLLGAATPALSQLPLNTGYNYTTFNTYPVSAQDNYWIEVAASAAPVPQPGFVVPNAPWSPPIVAGGTASQWISGTPNRVSYPGTSPSNPSYSIFRKCFCLLPGYKNPQIRFQIRADDAVQVWLNSQLNTMLPPSPGNFSGPALNGGTNNPAHFRVGRNCVYVLVEDAAAIFGFNLHGNVTGLGIMPTAAAGTGMSFRPCACETPIGPVPLSAGARPGASAEDDSEVIAALVKIAEERRRAKSRK